MRRNAAKALAIALALLCGSAFSTAPLLAKPTRMLTRTSAHKLAVTPPAHRAARSRANASDRSSLSAPHLRRSKQADREVISSKTASNRTDRRDGLRSGNLAEQRATAAQAAIDAADRGSRQLVRQPGSRRSRLKLERASLLVSRQRAEPARNNPPATGEPVDTATSPGPAVLTNIDGVLRATSDSLAVNSLSNVTVAATLAQPLRLSSLYDSGGRLILPKPLYGSHEILLHQNEMADRDGLNRVQDDADLLELRREKQLVALPESEALRVDYRLPEDRRYSRPWTAAFLSLVAADFYATFRVPLQVDSAVRTVAVQRRLLRTNGNAAPTTGEAASPHLTGQAVDIAKGGLNLAEIAWMRTYLQPFIDGGKIDVEEEFRQSCFHISVYKSFLPGASSHVSIAAARQVAPENETERPNY